MSAAKHTPGPWEVDLCDEGGFAVFVPPMGYMGWMSVVASRGRWTHNAEQSHANARLIAAAPELLEALKAAVDEVDGTFPFAFLDAARAAIAKATGSAQ